MKAKSLSNNPIVLEKVKTKKRIKVKPHKKTCVLSIATPLFQIPYYKKIKVKPHTKTFILLIAKSHNKEFIIPTEEMIHRKSVKQNLIIKEEKPTLSNKLASSASLYSNTGLKEMLQVANRND